jgi:putative ABC transport system substrate-binding protein
VVVRVARTEEIARAFNEIIDRKADVLYLPPLTFSLSHRSQFIDRSIKARLPLLSGHHDTTVAGGLLSYGTWREENFRRAAALVDKILRGASPAELPVEQPERFQLVVNMKTAKAIGVSLSPTTMLRADKVIE